MAASVALRGRVLAGAGRQIKTLRLRESSWRSAHLRLASRDSGECGLSIDRPQARQVHGARSAS